LVQVRSSPEKGREVLAITDIPRGTRIIAEAALLKIYRDHGDARNILDALKNLTASKKSLCLDLHGFACAAFRCAAEQEMAQSW
jgi:hypothetical protein